MRPARPKRRKAAVPTNLPNGSTKTGLVILATALLLLPECANAANIDYNGKGTAQTTPLRFGVVKRSRASQNHYPTNIPTYAHILPCESSQIQHKPFEQHAPYTAFLTLANQCCSTAIGTACHTTTLERTRTAKYERSTLVS